MTDKKKLFEQLDATFRDSEHINVLTKEEKRAYTFFIKDFRKESI